jgi:signal recognition particle receptor subunit beta
VASPPSSNFLLLGPSGAGKTAFTTLVRTNQHSSLRSVSVFSTLY